jgi:hypothetical protein
MLRMNFQRYALFLGVAMSLGAFFENPFPMA